ncbi:MAG: hypothetical protein R3F51_19825 [Cyanobacteriota/Melainabacteria group bacterium]
MMKHTLKFPGLVRSGFALVLLGLTLVLSGCGESDNTPPPPPPVYEVVHYNHDMEVISVERTSNFYASQGCAFYQPEHYVSGDRYNMICGNVEAYRVDLPTPATQPNASANNQSRPTVYLVEQLRPDGTVFKSHRAINFYASEGCAFFQPEDFVSGRYNMICGDVKGRKLPQ